jgi:glycosyltransferase involved in cell wall biosynthesis
VKTALPAYSQEILQVLPATESLVVHAKSGGVAGLAAALREDNRGQQLVLAGPPLDGASARFGGCLRREGLIGRRDVVLHPPVYDMARWQLLQRADVFLHPSPREGIPRSVVEALARGVAAIVSAETDLATEAEHAAAGWRVDAFRSA